MYYMIKKIFSIGIEPITWGDLLLRRCLQSPALPNELTEELVWTNTSPSVYILIIYLLFLLLGLSLNRKIRGT